MESDVHIFTADGANTVRAERQSLESLGLTEVAHLERWVVDHPEVLGGDVMVVSTQYDRWSSTSGDRAKERLDILGLDVSGQPVVVELKRGSDSRIHLQAITYASLVAGFSENTLAQAHADYLNREPDQNIAVDEARRRIAAHIEEGVSLEDTLRVPKIVLIAEQFSAQTYTTVSWLAEIAPNLTIELHTVNAFRFPDQANPCVAFRRLYPVDDPDGRVLTPTAAALETAVAEIAERNRRRRSVAVLFESGTIPVGATLQLRLGGMINAGLLNAVEDWIGQQPSRGEAVWNLHRSAPLQWGADPGSGKTWTLTGLAVHVIREATGEFRDAIPGGDVWFFAGRSLADLARSAESEGI